MDGAGQGSTAHKVQRLPLARATNITVAQLVEAASSNSSSAHWQLGCGDHPQQRRASILSGTGRPSGGSVVASQRPLMWLRLELMGSCCLVHRIAYNVMDGSRSYLLAVEDRGEQWKGRAWHQS